MHHFTKVASGTTKWPLVYGLTPPLVHAKKTAKRISGRIVNPHSREWSWELNNFNISLSDRGRKRERDSREPKPSFSRYTSWYSFVLLHRRHWGRKTKIELPRSLFWQQISWRKQTTTMARFPSRVAIWEGRNIGGGKTLSDHGCEAAPWGECSNLTGDALKNC